MADIRLSSDKEVGIRLGNGQNHLTFKANEDRAGIEAGIGAAERLRFDQGSRVYLGAGAGVAVSANRNPGPYIAPRTPHPGKYSDRMSLPEATALAQELRVNSQGSYDIGNIPITRIVDMLDRYPSLLSVSQSQTLRKVQRETTKAVADLEAIRVSLYDTLMTNPNLQQGGTLDRARARFARPVTLDSLEHLTVNQLDKLISTTLSTDPKLAGAAARFSDGANDTMVAIGEIFKLDNADAVLLPQERRDVAVAFQAVAMGLREAQTKMDEIPSPDSIERFDRQTARIMRWNPELQVHAYVAAAYESRVFSGSGGSAVIGASHASGVRATPNNVFAVRNGDNNGAHLEIIPSHTVEKVVFAGAGTHPYAAMPRTQAHQLGIVPSEARESIGAYFAVRENSETFEGVRFGKVRRVEIAGNYMQHDGGGRYSYVEAGLAQEKRPNETPKTKVQLSVGKIF